MSFEQITSAKITIRTCRTMQLADDGRFPMIYPVFCSIGFTYFLTLSTLPLHQGDLLRALQDELRN